MTGYALERTIVGWRSDFNDNPHQDRRFTTVYEDGMVIHFPWGRNAFHLAISCGSEEMLRFLCHEPDYRPIVADPEQRFECFRCGQVVRPVFELRKP